MDSTSIEDHFLITFDVAVKPTSSTSTTICRSYNSSLRFVITNFTNSTNPNQGEAMAAVIRVQEAHSQHIKNVIIERDSTVAISTINQPEKSIDWKMEGIARDRGFLLRNFETWRVVKIHRFQN